MLIRMTGPEQPGFASTGELVNHFKPRIVNLTDEPISEISTLWDFRLPAWPTAFSRWRTYNGFTLGAGESIEDAVDPTQQYFVGLDEKVGVPGGMQAGTRWFDIVLRVQFRDSNGFLQQVERQKSITANG